MISVNITAVDPYTLVEKNHLSGPGFNSPTAGTPGTPVLVRITTPPRHGRVHVWNSEGRAEEAFELVRLLNGDVKYVHDGSEEEEEDSLTAVLMTAEQKLILANLSLQVWTKCCSIMSLYFEYLYEALHVRVPKYLFFLKSNLLS